MQKLKWSQFTEWAYICRFDTYFSFDMKMKITALEDTGEKKQTLKI